MGFLGPVAIKIPLVIDTAVAAMPTVVVGGNEVDVHLKGVVPGRDFPLDQVHDLRNADAGDPCPRCGQPLKITPGLEIGHVFKLGTKYSKSMGASSSTTRGTKFSTSWVATASASTGSSPLRSRPPTTTTVFVWPLALAPYHVVVVPLQVQNAAVLERAEQLEKALAAAGLDVLIDDRDQSPGVKFKDADLIGIPLRVVVGERGLKDGTIEIKWRNQPEAKHIPAASAAESIVAEVAAARQRHDAYCAERRQTRAAGRGA